MALKSFYRCKYLIKVIFGCYNLSVLRSKVLFHCVLKRHLINSMSVEDVLMEYPRLRYVNAWSPNDGAVV